MSSLRSFSPLTMSGQDWKKTGQFLFGKGPHLEKFRTLNTDQKRYLNDIFSQLKGQNINLSQSPLYQQGSSYLSNLLSGSPESTAAFEAPIKREFNEQIMPGIAEQFAGVGGLRSSGFQQQATQAGAGLAERLQALRSALQMQGAGEALGYAQAPAQQAYGYGSLGLGTQPFGYQNFPQQKGSISSIAQLLSAFK